MKKKDLYMYGAGGFGRELRMIVDQINQQKNIWNIVGFIDDDIKKKTQNVYRSLSVLGDASVLEQLKEDSDVVLAIGDSYVRERIYEKLKHNPHLHFPNIIHPSVEYEKETLKLGIGNILLINTILSTAVSLGNFNVCNMGAIVGHDVTIGNFATINPGCNIGGGVAIGNHCELGMGCSIVQGLTLHDDVKIAGNSLVTQNCESGYLYLGIPAKKAMPLHPKL